MAGPVHAHVVSAEGPPALTLTPTERVGIGQGSVTLRGVVSDFTILIIVVVVVEVYMRLARDHRRGASRQREHAD